MLLAVLVKHSDSAHYSLAFCSKALIPANGNPIFGSISAQFSTLCSKFCRLDVDRQQKHYEPFKDDRRQYFFDPQAHKQHAVMLVHTCMSATRPRKQYAQRYSLRAVLCGSWEKARFLLKIQFLARILCNLANSAPAPNSARISAVFMWTDLRTSPLREASYSSKPRKYQSSISLTVLTSALPWSIICLKQTVTAWRCLTLR